MEQYAHLYGMVGIEEEVNQPLTFNLEQNYPNPFNPATTIKYSIPEKVKSQNSKFKNVTLKIYDILGREIVVLVNEEQKPGNYEVKWDASNQPSGVYFYQLTADEFVKTRKMVLLR